MAVPAHSLTEACKGKPLSLFFSFCFCYYYFFNTAYLCPETANFAGKLYAYFVYGAALCTALAGGPTG